MANVQNCSDITVLSFLVFVFLLQWLNHWPTTNRRYRMPRAPLQKKKITFFLRASLIVFYNFSSSSLGRAGWKPLGLGFQFTTLPVCPIDEYWPPKLIQWTLATFYGHFKCTVTFSPTWNCWIWNRRFCAVSERETAGQLDKFCNIFTKNPPIFSQPTFIHLLIFAVCSGCLYSYLYLV